MVSHYWRNNPHGIRGFYDLAPIAHRLPTMNLQSKKGNVPSKDKLPSCSTWFRVKAERKIMLQRKRLSKLKQEHRHEQETVEESTSRTQSNTSR